MLGVKEFENFQKGTEKQYLITNGLGGYSSSTIIGANISKHHALLNVALNPPTERVVLVSKIDEKLEIGKEKYELSSNQNVGEYIEGFRYQTSFELEPLPVFKYRVKDVLIEKTIAFKYNSNTISVVYNVRTLNNSVKLKLSPVVNYREHDKNSALQDLDFEFKHNNDRVILNLKENINLKISSSHGKFNKQPRFHENMYYRDDEMRGLNPIDNHFIPGYFEVEIPENSNVSIGVICSTDEEEFNPFEIIKDERQRLELIKTSKYKNKVLQKLTLASDAYIVNRKSIQSKTVVAGYPFFTDWGRDTMIAFTGLTLCTGRYEDAKEILGTFAKYLKKGIIPNMFPDTGVEPIYNTIDASLWYFYAVYKYYEYTKDTDYIKEILPTLEQILDNYSKGTLNDICMDEDGLIMGGKEGTQLTWMDIKVYGWVPTPRHGKAVEINALWYNALKTYDYLNSKVGADTERYKELSEKVKKSFLNEFWYEEGQYLHDVIREDEIVSKIRPNMIYAVSLPFTMLEDDKSKKVVDVVIDKLLTPYGIRTLDREDKEYQPIYRGTLLQRDGAYHRGTVWSFLVGHFITAFIKVYKDKKRAYDFLKPLIAHLDECCLDQISEVFDGDFPHAAGACFAQAWSVGELLRCLVEDINLE